MTCVSSTAAPTSIRPGTIRERREPGSVRNRIPSWPARASAPTRRAIALTAARENSVHRLHRATKATPAPRLTAVADPRPSTTGRGSEITGRGSEIKLSTLSAIRSLKLEELPCSGTRDGVNRANGRNFRRESRHSPHRHDPTWIGASIADCTQLVNVRVGCYKSASSTYRRRASWAPRRHLAGPVAAIQRRGSWQRAGGFRAHPLRWPAGVKPVARQASSFTVRVNRIDGEQTQRRVLCFQQIVRGRNGAQGIHPRKAMPSRARRTVSSDPCQILRRRRPLRIGTTTMNTMPLTSRAGLSSPTSAERKLP